MSLSNSSNIQSAEVVLPCQDLDRNIAFFTDTLQFRVYTIGPADDPVYAVLKGHGLNVRLLKTVETATPSLELRILCKNPLELCKSESVTTLKLLSPEGVAIHLVEAEPPLSLPELQPQLVVSKLAETQWTTGRASMMYRDLIPGRQGGRFVASHIKIVEGGDVPDYVHFHKVETFLQTL